MSRIPTLLAFLYLSFFLTPAHAACTQPEGPTGAMVFNTTTKAMQYCNGTSWVNAGASIPTAATTGCTSPTGPAGGVIYNGALGVIQFCNGENWVDTACATTRSPNGSGCTTPTGKAGDIIFETTSNEAQFCDSTNWVAMGWPCAGASTGLTDWSLAKQLQKVTASDGSSGQSLGTAVALHNDTAILGAYSDNGQRGAAYIFTRTNGVWSQQAKLIANDAEAGDLFGISVAIDGDTALIGTQGDDDKGDYAGAAYIFVRNGTTWTQQAKLTADYPSAPGIRFGNSVALSNDTALVGAYMASEAYVFTRSGTTWTIQSRLAGISSYAAWSVALSGNTALVSSHNNHTKGNYAGAVVVYTRNGTTWTEQQRLYASDAAADAEFSKTVALNGDTALIYAARSGNGRAYVFTRTSGVWTQQAQISPPAETGMFGSFGYSLALSGNTALIGAYGDDDKGASSGSAFIFTRKNGVWTQKAKLTATDGEASDAFGYNVALDGTTALIGANGDDDRANAAGAAYFFTP